MSEPVLRCRDLSLAYTQHKQVRLVVHQATIDLRAERILGLAGESGCGKSTLALALTGYSAPGLVKLGGTVCFRGTELGGMPQRRLRSLWGTEIAYLPQDTSTALDPARRIDFQFVEVLRTHLRVRGREAEDRAVELLERMGIPDAGRAIRKYAHQFSGGQQQRIALALALACSPSVLILDEPTTGLDVTTQARINDLIVEVARERGMATLYISHNLALLGELCDELAIMYGGQIVEAGSASEVLTDPRHPYTAALCAAVPTVHRSGIPAGIPGMPPATVELSECGFARRCTHVEAECRTAVPLRLVENRHVRCVRAGHVDLGVRIRREPSDLSARYGRQDETASQPDAMLLRGEGLMCTYHLRSNLIVAVKNVTFSLKQGTILGVAGESGSGKSTLLRALCGLLVPSAGIIWFKGDVLEGEAGKRSLAVRKAIQIVFQNPDSALNPRHTIRQILERPLQLFRRDLSKTDRQNAIREVLEQMRMPISIADRYPRQLSGGQRQRIALARALVCEPEILLLDEVTSALDVSVQASLLELLAALRAEYGTTMIFVTHDLGVLRSLVDEMMVMKAGEIVETGTVTDVFVRPRHPYTAELLNAVPDLERVRFSVQRRPVLLRGKTEQ